MKSLWSSWLRWVGPEPNWIEVARVKSGDRETFRYHDHRCAVGYLRSWLRERKASL